MEFRTRIANKKNKKYQSWNYWGKPVVGYGSYNAKLLIVGLAPAAHGANRTGRVFTGDKSADFLVECLHLAGIANQPTSTSIDDGLKLLNTYMTPALKCVPPEDKPLPIELQSCAPFFHQEVAQLKEVKAILALGKIAFDTCLKLWQKRCTLRLKDYPFKHHAFYTLPDGMQLIACYHPSPRNVNTGRINKQQMLTLLEEVNQKMQITDI